MNHVRIGDVALAVRGVAFSSGDVSRSAGPGLIACLTTSAVQTELDWGTARYIPDEIAGSDQILRGGDLLVSTANSRSLVGRAALVEEATVRATFGAFVTVLRPGPAVEPSYLNYWLRTDAFLREARSRASQTTSIANLRVSDLLAMELPLPAVQRQRRIVARLTETLAVVDRARVAAADRRKNVDWLIEAELSSVLSSRVGWHGVALHDVVEIQLGKMLSPASRTGRRPIPYVRNANVQWDRVDLTDVAEMDFDEREEAKFALRPGDVLVCEGGEPGRAAVWRGEISRCCYQKALHRLRPLNEAVDPEFLVFTFWLASLRGEFAEGHAQTTIAHLPAVRLSELRISLPSLPTQRRLASQIRRRLDAIRHLQREIQGQVDTIDRLPAAILREAFEGFAA